MKTGDIVLIPFPFSELTQVKVRPALVITETKDKYKGLVLCAISSQVPVNLSTSEILLRPTVVNGLKVQSVLKVDRIFTLKAEKVIANLGSLNVSERVSFRGIFQSLVE